MRSARVLVAAVVATVVASGCAQRVVRESGGDIVVDVPADSWGGSFNGREGWSDTRASVFARPVDGGTQVSVTVEGGIPGSRYGWELREGACGANGRVIGESAKYQPVLLGEEGMGSAVMQLPARLESGKQYSVVLYGDATERSLTIACGAITK